MYSLLKWLVKDYSHILGMEKYQRHNYILLGLQFRANKVAYLKSTGSKRQNLHAKRLSSLSQLQQIYNSRHVKRTPNLTTCYALDRRSTSTEKQQENVDYK